MSASIFRDKALAVQRAIIDAKAADNKDARADLKAAIRNMTMAQSREAAPSDAPATAAQTAEQANAQERDALMFIAELAQNALDQADLVEQLKMELEATQAQVADAVVKLDDESRKMQFDVTGRIKGEFSREAHIRMLHAPTSNEQIIELRKLSDQVAVMHALRGSMKNRNFDVMNTSQYKELELKTRAMYSTGSTVGDELVMNELSPEVVAMFNVERQVAATIKTFQLPRGEWTIPNVTANPTVYLQGESSSDDASAYKASNMTLAQRSMVAATLAARVAISSELDEDSVAPMMELLSPAFAEAMAQAEENAIINGQATSAIDTGDAPGPNDVRSAFDGIRYNVQTAAKEDLSTWSAATVFAMISGMGKYGIDPRNGVWVPSLSVYLKKMVSDSNFVSLEKAGPLATNINGSLGFFYGRAVLPSDQVSESMNASGVYDGVTETKTGVILFRPDRYKMGVRRGMTIDSETVKRAGQTHLIVTMREVLRKMGGTTDYTEALGYNIAN